ncbi:MULTISPECIES: hypothetical protein [Psychrobacter]|jgi:hypothetical protein|uniref:Uncharacterized protein n=1 Tax=Psychrobacter glaciei TaxID=619771 RepID=A0ABQ3GLW1_9GAMM|nr:MULTISPECIES: hypothetical protein [Psychrobacter]MBP3945296.1 hypothetical protein [Psychrobacter sp. K31L]MCH1781719.1 hypothetical protein [Psychrobacter glaciei]GHD25853.1 hypothetical protein GCM10016272_02140 [Psychrobacter glaciei]
MSDLNKSDNKSIDTDVNTNPSLARQEINSQQVSIKAWSQKLLVVLLCVASFYGGWKSYESNMVNECTANGGQMVAGDRTMICQLS